MKRSLLTIAVVFFLGLAVWLGAPALLGRGASVAGTRTLDIPFTVGDVSLNPFTGVATLSDLVLHSVEPFEAPWVVRVDQAQANFEPTSLVTGVILIEQVVVDGAQVVVEQRGAQLNVRDLAGRFASYVAETDTSESMRVFVREFRFTNGRGTLKTDAGQRSFAMRDVVLRDLGSESAGTPLEVVAGNALEPLLVETIRSAGLPTERLGRLRGLLNR